jgi:hypothetical protein
VKLRQGAAVSTLAGLLLAAPAAFGQGAPGQADAPPVDPGRLNPIPGTPDVPPETAPRQESTVWKPLTGYGVALTAGGGISNFVGTIRDETSTAGMWNVRVSYGTRVYMGVEGAYLGAAGPINGLGPGAQSTLVRNGVEGTLRMNAPLMSRVALVEPYIFGGVGWDHYSVSTTSVSTSLDAGDDVVTAPVGLGFDFTYRGLVADGRFCYRATFGENKNGAGTRQDLSNWTLGAQLGYEF